MPPRKLGSRKGGRRAGGCRVVGSGSTPAVSRQLAFGSRGGNSPKRLAAIRNRPSQQSKHGQRHALGSRSTALPDGRWEQKSNVERDTLHVIADVADFFKCQEDLSRQVFFGRRDWNSCLPAQQSGVAPTVVASTAPAPPRCSKHGHAVWKQCVEVSLTKFVPRSGTKKTIQQRLQLGRTTCTQLPCTFSFSTTRFRKSRVEFVPSNTSIAGSLNIGRLRQTAPPSSRNNFRRLKAVR